MKRAYILVIPIIIIFVIIIFTNLFSSKSETFSDGEEIANYDKIVKEIANEHEYSVEKINNFTYDDSYYSSYFTLEKEGLNHVIQVSIGKSSINEQPLITINIYREIESEKEMKFGLDKHFDLIVSLINEFSENKISSSMLNEFFKDDENVTMRHEFDKYWETYYAVKKSEKLNETCDILYNVYTCAYVAESGRFTYHEEDGFDEEISISTIESLK